MTLVVGILCTDGVVIGTDSATTQIENQVVTIEQPNREKVRVIDNKAIIAGTGSVGLGQRFEHEARKCLNEKGFGKREAIEVGCVLSRVAIKNFQDTHLGKVEYGALLAFPCKEGFALVEFAVGDFQPELKTERNWYVSMGAGKPVADPLLGFMRKVFWGDSPPNRQEGVFAAAMVLTLGCDMAPMGVSDPIQLAVLAEKEKGKLSAQKISSEEQQEHLESVNSALEYFRDYSRHLLSQDEVPLELPSAPE